MGSTTGFISGINYGALANNPARVQAFASLLPLRNAYGNSGAAFLDEAAPAAISQLHVELQAMFAAMGGSGEVVPGSVVIAPVTPTTTRVVGVRGQVANVNTASITYGIASAGNVGPYTRVECESADWSGPDGIVNPTPVFGGFFFGPADFNQVAQTVDFAIRYGGATYSMAGTASVAPGSSQEGTPVTVTIPPNTKFLRRMGVVIASGERLYPQAGLLAAIGDYTVQSNAGVSQVATNAPIAIPAGGVAENAAYGTMLVPLYLKSTQAFTMPSIGILGDSIADANGLEPDTGPDAWGAKGYISKALDLFAVGPLSRVKFTRTGQTARNMALTTTHWAAACANLTHLICNLGINDVLQTPGTNFTLAVIKANLTIIWAAARAANPTMKLYQCLLGPSTSDANGLANPATRFGPGEDRDLLNTWILAQVGVLIDDTFNPNTVMASGGNPNVFATGITGDGLHILPAKVGQVAVSLATWLSSRLSLTLA